MRLCSTLPRSTRTRRVAPLSVEVLEDRLAPATFSVTNTNDAGPGSLRAAILAANAHLGADMVSFSIPGGGVLHSIPLASALPALTGTITLAGDTQPGFAGNPLIELNGTSAGSAASGLLLNAPGAVVRDLVINRFAGDGVQIRGSSSRVEGCFIGINAAGTAAAANGRNGVRLFARAANVSIGGATAETRNVISGNGKAGVLVVGSDTTGNKVEGNVIGLNAAGTAAVANKVGVWVTGGAASNTIGGVVGNTISGNAGAGVALTGTGTVRESVSNNRIGTDPTGAAARANGGDGVLIAAGSRSIVVQGNVVSANGGNGVTIRGPLATGIQVRGNHIGLNAAGTAALANTFDGVQIAQGAHGNTVGGTTVAQRNLIGGNRANGVEFTDAGTTGNTVLGNFIGTNAAGTAAVGNANDGVAIQLGASHVVVGGTASGAGNVISGNVNGVEMSSSQTGGNVVLGNFIGTNATGTGALGNSHDGVFIRIPNNTVGGTAAGARNVISGNTANGVEILGGNATGNKVQGNFVGTNVLGTASIGNGMAGVALSTGAEKNVVGGTSTGSRNVISGNSYGVEIIGANLNLVQGNFLGTDAGGTVDLGNTNDGVIVTLGAALNTVGGTTPGARNVISGNNRHGITLEGAGGPVLGNIVQGNFIGTDVHGTADLGNSLDGVHIASGAGTCRVGGATPAARNVISGNDRNGVLITDLDSSANISGNYIGLAADGSTALGNTKHGVFVTNQAAFNLIGVSSTGTGNVIAHNGGAGVLIGNDPSQGATVDAGRSNSVQGNSIFANGALGIDLGTFGTVTANDANDADTGPNDLENFPILTAALFEGDNLLLSGSINTVTNATVRIEFFASAAADPSGNGEGQTFLGFVNVATGGNNTVGFSVAFVTSLVRPGDVITATATGGGGTSEFSLALTAI